MNLVRKMKKVLMILAAVALVSGCETYRSTYSHTENVTQSIEQRPDGLIYFDPTKITIVALSESPALLVTESVSVVSRTNGVATTNVVTTISTRTNVPVVEKKTAP